MSRQPFGSFLPAEPARAEQPLMTQGEVAALFSVSTRTVRNWVARGLLSPVKRGGVVRYRRVDVETFAGLNEPANTNEKSSASLAFVGSSIK